MSKLINYFLSLSLSSLPSFHVFKQDFCLCLLSAGGKVLCHQQLIASYIFIYEHMFWLFQLNCISTQLVLKMLQITCKLTTLSLSSLLRQCLALQPGLLYLTMLLSLAFCSKLFCLYILSAGITEAHYYSRACKLLFINILTF